jgi:tetratricopeptide (TPR) repeat protein
MPRSGWCAALLVLVLLVACQAPAPIAPTAAPPAPTSTLAPPAPTSTVAPPAPTPTTPSVTNSRVETLNAANAAFRSGDLKTAAGFYERVINTPPSGEAAALTQAINDFARFRAMVTLLADGREDEAHIHLDALQTRDANAAFARLGNQLWDQYGMTGQLRGACAQLQPQIASQAGPVLTTLQASGVTVDAQTLCSVS